MSHASARRRRRRREPHRHRVVHPGRGAGTRHAPEDRAGASDDHGRLHRHDGHGSTARARWDRKDLADALDARIFVIQEAALRFEVPFYETDVGKSSVKALLTAGAPSSTGRDEERMLRALREVMDRPGIVPMRVGVNTGKVFTGDFGPPYRRAYRVFGDAINTAARVMSKAEAGQISRRRSCWSIRGRSFEATLTSRHSPPRASPSPLRASIVGQPIGHQARADRGQPRRSWPRGRVGDDPRPGRTRSRVRGTAWTVEIGRRGGCRQVAA